MFNFSFHYKTKRLRRTTIFSLAPKPLTALTLQLHTILHLTVHLTTLYRNTYFILLIPTMYPRALNPYTKLKKEISRERKIVHTGFTKGINYVYDIPPREIVRQRRTLLRGHFHKRD